MQTKTVSFKNLYYVYTELMEINMKRNDFTQLNEELLNLENYNFIIVKYTPSKDILFSKIENFTTTFYILKH